MINGVDSRSEVTVTTFKAVQPVEKHMVSTHDCAACAQKTVSLGRGKMATLMVAHTCDMESKDCCATE